MISKLYTLLCDFGAFSSPEPVVSWSRGRETSGSVDENGFWWNSVQRKALMRTMCSREIFRKKCRQQQIFESDLKWAWHYNHVTFNPIAKHFMLYCRLIYMLSTLCVRLTIKVKVEIPESFNVGWYPPLKTGSSHLNVTQFELLRILRSTFPSSLLPIIPRDLIRALRWGPSLLLSL